MEEIVEYYDFDADAFHKEVGGNPRKFLPPEYMPLLKIIMQEHKNNPASKKQVEKKLMLIMSLSTILQYRNPSEQLNNCWMNIRKC